MKKPENDRKEWPSLRIETVQAVKKSLHRTSRYIPETSIGLQPDEFNGGSLRKIVMQPLLTRRQPFDIKFFTILSEFSHLVVPHVFESSASYVTLTKATLKTPADLSMVLSHCAYR